MYQSTDSTVDERQSLQMDVLRQTQTVTEINETMCHSELDLKKTLKKLDIPPLSSCQESMLAVDLLTYHKEGPVRCYIMQGIVRG